MVVWYDPLEWVTVLEVLNDEESKERGAYEITLQRRTPVEIYRLRRERDRPERVLQTAAFEDARRRAWTI
jgi:hypothetical protein